MGVSKNNGTPKSSILINRVFHYFHHPFWGTPIFGNIHIQLGMNASMVTFGHSPPKGPMRSMGRLDHHRSSPSLFRL